MLKKNESFNSNLTDFGPPVDMASNHSANFMQKPHNGFVSFQDLIQESKDFIQRIYKANPDLNVIKELHEKLKKDTNEQD